MKTRCKLFRNGKESVNKYFRKAGMEIGSDCNICSSIMTSEPYLISIGNDVTISGNVIFVTHDNSVAKIFRKGNDLYGKIHIGDGCFIGQNSTITYGVSLSKNVIVTAGSVVTKSINQENVIVAGNPAKIIKTVEDFSSKVKDNVICMSGFSEKDKKRKVFAEEKKWISK